MNCPLGGKALFFGMTLRVRIKEQLFGSIDGIRLDDFVVGSVYDVGTSLGSYLLAEGVAEPADVDAVEHLRPGDLKFRVQLTEPDRELTEADRKERTPRRFDWATAADQARRRKRR